MSPDDIAAARLSRSRMGGYDVAETDELLRAVAWDYRRLLHEHQTLADDVSRINGEAAERANEIESLKAEVERRRHPDELARAVLDAAQRAARELRDTTRAECEAALKQARSRASEIETEVEQATASLRADLERLEHERERARELLQAALTAALQTVQPSNSGLASPEAEGPAPSESESLVRALRVRSARGA
jgi:DivIVA domain-containing protein